MPLSAEQIESFVENGYLILRGCFSRARAAELVRESLVLRTPAPKLAVRGRFGVETPLPETVDPLDPTTWGTTRLDIETSRSLEIASFAPTLWDAITSLVGPEHEALRTTMGERWILNANFAPPPRPELDPGYVGKFDWHIDVTSEHATLDERRDALALLVAWSDIEPGGGGPLFSGESLGHVVRLFESQAVDTREYAWATSIAQKCRDLRELTAEAGDVVVMHALALHAAHLNHSSRVRILENPTVMVREPLRFHPGAERSPVERAVIRRLARPRAGPPPREQPIPRPAPKPAASVRTRSPSFTAGRDATGVRPVPAWMRALADGPVDHAVAWALPAAVRARLITGARSVVVELRERPDRTFESVSIPDGVPTSIRAHDAREVATFCARVRWISTQVLGASGAVSYQPTEAEVRCIALSAALARVRSPQDARGLVLPAIDPPVPIARFLDVACGRWDAVFAYADRDAASAPAWLAPIVLGVSGDLDAVRGVDSVDEGALATPMGAALERLGFGDAARVAYERAAAAVLGPDRADVLLALADVHHGLGDLPSATAWARRALLTRASDDGLLHRVCERLVRWGALDDAHAALAERCGREPDDPRSLVALTELLLWAGRATEAGPWIERLRVSAPDHRDLPRLDGIVAALSQRWDDALDALTRSVAQGVLMESTWLVELHLRRGDRAAAKHHLAEARPITQTAIHTLLGAALSNMEDVSVDVDLAALLDCLGEPRWKGQPIDVEARALAALSRFGGNRTSHLTQLGGAGELGIETFRLPAHDPILASRDAAAYLLKRIGTMPLADLEAGFAELAERHVGSPHPLCYWGELALWLGDYERAISLFDRALARGSARWGYVGKLAALVLRGEHALADAELERCAKLFEPVVGATTFVYVGESLRLRGEHAAARDQLAEAVRVKTGRVGAWLNLALVHHAMGATEEALSIFEMVSSRWPRLIWDASAAAFGAPAWPAAPEQMEPLFLAALRSMRGNRSSHTITYFDRDERLRVLRGVEWWSATCASHTRFLAADLRDRLAGGVVSL